MLTSAALASTVPLVVAPAMNNHMWEHPATRGNVETLRLRGATIVAAGYRPARLEGGVGEGRLAEPAEILTAVEGTLSPRSLEGVRVLVTAGGTREPIDSVRYVGNRSSGRMGIALAQEAERRGAEVTLVAANVALDCPAGHDPVSTAAELDTAARRAFPDCDVLLMAAAVADFRPAAAADAKISKAGRERPGRRDGADRRLLAGLSSSRRPTDPRRLCRRARGRRPRACPGQARAQGARRRGAQRHLRSGDRLRRRRQRGHDRHRGRRAARGARSQALSRGCHLGSRCTEHPDRRG